MENISENATLHHGKVVCHSPKVINGFGIWQGANPLSFSLPLFTVQVVLAVVTTRIMVLLLRPFHQPRLLAEIMAGVVLGPSVIGRAEAFGDVIFPQRSLLILETIAHLSLLYFLFLIGVEMDITVISRTGQKALVIAAVGTILPFAIGVVTSFMFQSFFAENARGGAFLLFLGVALSVTAFPVLARILAEIKLLNSEIGRISMSAAIINDVCAWILLTISMALAEPEGNVLSCLWVYLCGVGFVLGCFYGVRPAISWLMRKIPEGQPVSDFHVCLILSIMMLAAQTTDAIGIHSVFGAFVFGLVIPSGSLGVALIEKLEDLVTGLLLPLYFVVSGLRTDLSKVRSGKTAGLLILVFVLASISKVIGTIVTSLFYMMPLRDGISLGFLMNTKGLVEIIVLNIGRDTNVLDDESFSVMVITSLAMTAMVAPTVTYLQRPIRRFVGYKRRNLQRSNPDTELRVLTCVHNTRNVPSIISLLTISNPGKCSPIFVYALHLVELTGRASAMLIVHNTSSSTPNGHRKPVASIAGAQAQSDHIFHAFENYEHHAGGVSVQTLTIVSPYATMHEDICNLAEDKHVTLIILPFHKQQTVDGGMEPINPSIKMLNENVLSASPCSVGILIDRGLSSKSRIVQGQHHSYRIALLFFGGPDDREALAYAWRMSEHPAINLTVVRFIPNGSEEATTAQRSPVATPPSGAQEPRPVTIASDSTQEKQVDDEYLNQFRLRNVGNESLMYTEKAVSNTEETVGAIRSMGGVHDLYVVGRNPCDTSLTLTAGLREWAECPELGPIGDLLASSDFAMTVSVLVVHQYIGGPLGVSGAVVVEDVEQPMQWRLSSANQRLSPPQGSPAALGRSGRQV